MYANLGSQISANCTVINLLYRFFTATDNKVLGFTLVLIAASVDFWILKNIGGR